VTVIDCGQVVAGPTAAMLLGDFGAEVIKIENPAGGDQVRFFGRQKDGVPLHWKYLSRNKKAITLALNKPAGQALFCRLLETTRADVVVDSFRPGTLERWGLGPERLKALSPGVILVRLSGYGQFGPYRDRPGFGTLAESMSGFAHIVGQKDGPPTLPPLPLADTTAALYAAFGAMVCLYQRDAERREASQRRPGQTVDVSLLEPLFNVMSGLFIAYDQLGIVGQRNGNRTPGSAPRNTYRTKDDRWITIAASTQPLAARLFETMGRPDLLDDPRFRTNRDRVANVDALDEIVGAWMSKRTRDEIMALLIEIDVPVAPVADVGDLAADPHLAARESIIALDDAELGRLRMPAVQPKLSETPGRVDFAGPPLGSFNREIYQERLGLSEADLERLHADGVI
jgi:formyl-CoA transferase